jgi:hypothetical protein
MHPNQHAALRQRVRERADNVDAYGFFNLLTGPELLERVEGLLPEHRERVFPPTETLAMFLAQALSPDGSCRQAVDDAAVKRLIAGLAPHKGKRGQAQLIQFANHYADLGGVACRSHVHANLQAHRALQRFRPGAASRLIHP